MPKKIVKNVRVSRRSILAGIPEEVYLCPVSLAVRKVLKIPASQEVRVSDEITVFDANDNPLYVMPILPQKVIKFIDRFDRVGKNDTFYDRPVFKKNLKPFTFQLKLEEIEETVNKDSGIKL